jgi:hypothetical protein
MPSRDGSSGNGPIMRLDDASSHGFCILLDFPVNGGFVVEVPTLKQASTRSRSLFKMELLGGGVSSRQAGFEQEGCGIFFSDGIS